MNHGELFKSRAVEILKSPAVKAAFIFSTFSVVACFMGPKIIDGMDFQKAQDLWKSGNTLCQKTNEPVVIVGIPKNIMDQLSVAEPTVETPWIKNLHILNPGSDTNDDGVVGFACERERPVSNLPGTALTQIFQHNNSRG